MIFFMEEKGIVELEIEGVEEGITVFCWSRKQKDQRMKPRRMSKMAGEVFKLEICDRLVMKIVSVFKGLKAENQHFGSEKNDLDVIAAEFELPRILILLILRKCGFIEVRKRG